MPFDRLAEAGLAPKGGGTTTGALPKNLDLGGQGEISRVQCYLKRVSTVGETSQVL
jgi:hypothetical protein